MKTYFAKDIHCLKRDKHHYLVLGGIQLDSQYVIKAHSDGDIIIHTIVSCLLASLDQKTIGELFPDTDAINKDRSSIDFLKYALSLMTKQKLVINNIDLTIVCEQIILKNYLMQIKDSLIKLCKNKNISIKATRFEKKYNKRIECYCILTIK